MCVDDIIKEHLSVVMNLTDQTEQIKKVADKIIKCLKSGGTIFIAGNGGSASDAQHFSAELVGRFVKDRKPLRAICLNTDTSAITAISNDYGYENLFKRQLEGLARPGDMFIGITTSGKSQNVLNAFIWAKNNSVQTVALTGTGFIDTVDNCLCVQSKNTARIQEIHILIIHIICELIDG